MNNTDEKTAWPFCKNKRYEHKCHPFYFRKYNGYCLDCSNAGVDEVDEQIRAAEDAAWNAALEAAARRIESGSFLHDDAPDSRFSRAAVAAIRAIARPVTK